MKLETKATDTITLQRFQWINAKEHLPPPEKVVAVLTAGGKMLTSSIKESNTRAKYCVLNKSWSVSWHIPNQTGGKGKTDPHYHNEITHWMELPPSPLKLVEEIIP